jgi:hypothetical protein
MYGGNTMSHKESTYEMVSREDNKGNMGIGHCQHTLFYAEAPVYNDHSVAAVTTTNIFVH